MDYMSLLACRFVVHRADGSLWPMQVKGRMRHPPPGSIAHSRYRGKETAMMQDCAGSLIECLLPAHIIEFGGGARRMNDG